MKIYITHYSQLIERKKHIKKLLKEIAIEGEFIEEFDKEEIENKNFIQDKYTWQKQLSFIKKIFIMNIFENKKDKNIRSKIYWSFFYIFNKFLTPKSFRFRNLSLPEISLTLKHYVALKKIANSKEPGLIMEDDVILKPESKLLLEKSFLLCKSKFDYIDLGGGCELPLFEEDKFLIDEERFVQLKIPRSRTTAAYIISPESALKLASGILPVTMPIDWQYQFLFLKHNFKVLWTYPPAFIHGSKEGKDFFKSSIQT